MPTFNNVAAPEIIQSEEGRDARADEQRGTLDEVRPDHRGQAAVGGICAAHNPDKPDGGDHGPLVRGCGVHAEAVHEQFRQIHHIAQGDGAAEEDRGQQHDHVSDQQVGGHDGARARIVPVFQKLRHGVNTRRQEFRQEIPRHDNQRDGGHPFVTADGQSRASFFKGRTRHADEMFGVDVRRNQGEADNRPHQRTAREKVILNGRLAAAAPECEGDYRTNKAQENSHVNIRRNPRYRECFPHRVTIS